MDSVTLPRTRWLEDPLKFTYLRQNEYQSTVPRFPEKSKRLFRGGKLIGYRLYHQKKYDFRFEYWYLAAHDYDLQPDGPYGPDGGAREWPSEAIAPFLLPEPVLCTVYRQFYGAKTEAIDHLTKMQRENLEKTKKEYDAALRKLN